VEASSLFNLVGYRVVGRHGELGTVVMVRTDDAEGGVDPPILVVRGGRTELLLLHLPLDRLSGLFPEERLAVSELDIVDFAAHLGDDGRVELYLEP
jgi:hypothetical protein